MNARHVLIAFFIIISGLRIAGSFQSPNWSDDDSYLHMRQIEHISETGLPLIDDPLSYGGRTRVSLPFYDYLLGGVNKVFGNIDAIKISVSLIASALAISSYLLAYQVSKNQWVSLMVSLITSTTPIYIFRTLNVISTESLIIPVSVFFTYLFLRLEKDDNSIIWLILSLIFLVLSSSASFIVIFGLIVYSVICFIEKIKQPQKEQEFIFFSVFFYLWANFIIFKRAFQEQGIRIIWQNIPKEILKTYYFTHGPLEIISLIGIIPLVIGILTIYRYFGKKKSRQTYLLMSTVASPFILFWFKLVPFTQAISFLGVALCLLSTQGIKDGIRYLKRTKIGEKDGLIKMYFVILVVVVHIVPAIFTGLASPESIPDEETISALSWVRENTDENASLLVPLTIGNTAAYLSKRKVIMDGDFMLVDNAEIRYEDVKTLYETQYKIDAIRLIEKYDIDYIFFQDRKLIPKYVAEDCFKEVFGEKVLLVKNLGCSIG